MKQNQTHVTCNLLDDISLDSQLLVFDEKVVQEGDIDEKGDQGSLVDGPQVRQVGDSFLEQHIGW